MTIWFVADGPRRILVQHVAPKPAQWYRNLVADAEVRVDFGDGPIAARAEPITDPARIEAVLGISAPATGPRRSSNGWANASPVAAEISW
ncbi:MAG: nitroreductase/quinone reductase family protein [Candidatus Binatia bacterium]